MHALKTSLRGTHEADYQTYLEPTDLTSLTRYSNIAAALLDLQVQDVQTLRQTGQVDDIAFLALNDLLVRFSDSMGKCERIKNTLFPVTYLYFTRVFIWLLIFILSIDMAEEAGRWSIGLGWLIGFVFHVTHLNGLNLVNPFDGNPASVPLDSIVRTVEINVLQTFPPSPSPTETHKRIALLCMLSNVNYDLVAASEAELSLNTRKINDALQNNADVRAYLGTDWQVVWGPAIANSLKKSSTSAPDSFVTDNTMYVARGTDLDTGKIIHVVAIAGTNAVSQKDARLEDFNIVKEENWGTRSSGKISAGSALGFSILSAMRDAATGKTLLEFLGTLGEAGPTEVAFTGHSLGGALSPLMALKCIEWQQQMGYTNLNVSVYPIAGPTPGNKDFAVYAAQKFGEGYHSVINANDIVPHAWQKDMFKLIPSLYKNAPPFNPGGSEGFGLTHDELLSYDSLKVVVDLKTYQRIAPDREFVFQGKANVYPDGSGSFFQEAKYQHILAYYKDAFGFPESVIDALAN